MLESSKTEGPGLAEGSEITFRTATLAVGIRDCAGSGVEHFRSALRSKLDPIVQSLNSAMRLAASAGVHFESYRFAVTPLGSLDLDWTGTDYVAAAKVMDDVAVSLGAEFIGGFAR